MSKKPVTYLLIAELIEEILNQVEISLEGGRVEEARKRIKHLRARLQSAAKRHDRLIGLRELALSMRAEKDGQR